MAKGASAERTVREIRRRTRRSFAAEEKIRMVQGRFRRKGPGAPAQMYQGVARKVG